MSELAEKLKDLVRRPVLRPIDAERAGRAAEALSELLRAEEKAQQTIAGMASEVGEEPAGYSRNLAGKTLQDAAEAVLRDAGGPLHARELGRRIKARGWIHPRGKPSRPDQIVYQLAARLPRHPARFRRVAPNTFALVGSTQQGQGRKPRLALFKGPAEDVGRRIGELPELPPGDPAWR